MKMTKDKIKGITLIEVIISVALLSILIIPVSTMVMASLQINKKAEYKQKSAYIGQQILEELKVYSDIKLKDNSNFQLLDGNLINKYIEADNKYDFIGEFTRDDYKVNVTLKKNSKFKYEDSNNNKINITDSDFDFRINFLNDQVQLVKDNSFTSQNISNQLVLKVDDRVDDISYIGISLLDKGKIILSDSKSNDIKGKILLHLESSFKNQTIIEIEIEVENERNDERNDEIEIYVQRNEDSTGKFNIKSTKGKVKIYDNILKIKNENTGDLYNIEVSVSRGNDVLFIGTGTNNIIIRN